MVGGSAPEKLGLTCYLTRFTWHSVTFSLSFICNFNTMSLTNVSLKTKDLSLYVENDKGLLFNHTSCCLYNLPAISVFTVLLIDEGLSKDKVLITLKEKSDLHIKELFSLYWTILDMLALQGIKLSYADGQYPELYTLNTKSKSTLLQKTNNTYQVAGATFSIFAHTELLQDITALLAPRIQQLKSVDFEILITQEAELYCIYSNRILIEQCTKYLEVIPLIIDRLQILAFQKSDYTFCFHGAALSTPSGNLLLPGESGAGKSTLSAFLVDKDHRLYSDEIIALNDNFEIKVIPLPIAIKSGSWQIVAEKYPLLAQAKIWHRLDGRQLKYLWPTSFAEASLHTGNKTVLIHPQYSDKKRVDAKVTKLSVIDTISLLTASGYQLGFELNIEKLEKFIAFIQQSTNFRIDYNNSEQVTKVLGSIC
jgi:hypothetical protein